MSSTFDFKSATPVTSGLAATNFLLGAASQASTTPEIIRLDGLTNFLSTATLAAGTLTTSQPLTLTQTWNAGGVTFRGVELTFTDTAAASDSTFFRIQGHAAGVINSTVRFAIAKNGSISVGWGGTGDGYNLFMGGPTATAGSAVTTGRFNTAYGVGSMFAITTGDVNAAFGTDTMQSLTTGSGNNSHGDASLFELTTGQSNNAFGTSALNKLVSGQNNSAFGNQAAYNTTGDNNMAFGAAALFTNASGSYNVAVGYQAAYTYNNSEITAIGANALRLATGVNNTAVGTSAAGAVVAGAGNTAIGYSALTTNASGNFNTALGVQALNSTTATGNTAVGRLAGYETSSGSNNNYFGHQAGRGITTGSNNLVLGNATGLSSSLSSAIILAIGDGTIEADWNKTTASTWTFAGPIAIPAASAFSWAGRSLVTSAADGQIRLSNNAASDFSLLQFGGTTSSFPALKRNSAALDARLGDDSGYANLTAAGITATGNITVTSQVVIRGSASGVLRLTNGAETDFDRLSFGGTTASFPAWKRSSTALQARLADDSAYAPLSAELVNVAAGTATPTAGSAAASLRFGTTSGFGVYYGSGAPTVSAAQGSLYLRSDGSGVNDRAYINTNGSTTWTPIVTVG